MKQKLKHVAHVRVSSIDKKTKDGEVPVLLCNYVDVYNNDNITADLPFMSASANPSQLERLTLRPGDVLFTKDSETADDIAVPAFVAETLDGLVCGYHLAIATPRNNVLDGRFLYWSMLSRTMSTQFEVAATGITRFGLRQSSIGHVLLDVPPIDEQIRIAKFLDRECYEIDEALREYDRFAGLIEERDRESIKRLVTGRDEPGPHTSQGPYWLAPTPAKWTPLKIVNNFATGSGTTPTSTEAKYYGGDTYWLNSGECTDSVVYQTQKTVTQQALDEHSALKVYPPGSVVMAMYGATIGRLCVLGSPMTVNQACVVLHRPSDLDPWFTFWWLWAHREEIINLGQGGGQSNINQELVKQLRIPAPPLPVQQDIVTEIERARNWSQSTRDEASLQRELLLERKQALITAAVTGEIEVP